ncbi:MAG: cytochrome c3 family protein [Dissulfurispiraceae bacterium]
MVELLPSNPEVTTILFHDKNPEDLSFNYPVEERTCRVCHSKEVQELKRTAMGHNAKQGLYRTWTDKKMGPHNCGVWFVDGYEEIAKNTKVPFTREMASLNQKACNICHVGCLDCHYAPKKKDGDNPALGGHTFTKNVSTQSRYSGGRGSICHAGPEDSRRGAGYIGGPYSNPAGAIADIHYAKGVLCIDCHDTHAKDENLLHREVKRQVSCSKCHDKIVNSVVGSIHRKVSCEACHIENVGAYTGTFWGPGQLAGINTPFFKYKEYYGILKEPVLIRDQKGKWIPVKPYPMAVMNQKTAGDLKPGLAWRFPANLPDLDRTDDAYALVGLLSGLPENDNVLAWIQMDKMSHKFGKARGCESCHTKNGEQRQEVSWKYEDAGAYSFNGEHWVIASKKGLFIKNMRAITEIKVKEGWKIEDFAPWYYLKDKW